MHRIARFNLRFSRKQLPSRISSLRRLLLPTVGIHPSTCQQHTEHVRSHRSQRVCRCRWRIYTVLRSRTCTYTDQLQTALVIFSNWASQEFRLYENKRLEEVEWTVGPIPIEDQLGKEIILRYDTDIVSNGYFYTDANGREVLERKRDYRPSWNYTVYESVSGNYYPIPSRIWIKDQQRQLTILTGRSTSR